MPKQIFISLALLVLLPVGCAEDDVTAPPVMTADDQGSTEVEENTTASTSGSDGEASEQTGGRVVVDGLAFEVPKGWKRVQLSSFQLNVISARYTIPSKDGEITVTLSRAGGGMDANLDRWRGQVENSRDEIVDKMTLAGEPAILLDLEGRFSPGFGKPPADGQRMLGTIIEMPDNDYFIKLTGPADAVGEIKDEFRAFLKSASKA